MQPVWICILWQNGNLKVSPTDQPTDQPTSQLDIWHGKVLETLACLKVKCLMWIRPFVKFTFCCIVLWGKLPPVLPPVLYFLWEIAREELTRRKFIVNLVKRSSYTERRATFRCELRKDWSLLFISSNLLETVSSNVTVCFVVKDRAAVRMSKIWKYPTFQLVKNLTGKKIQRWFQVLAKTN